ncbi:hypothetical protein F4804DRAFT_96150 [Jackrogersella minutella]|nr:hypothetical protein F4804DRAFT_96150 [Jackrogersella minutella]
MAPTFHLWMNAGESARRTSGLVDRTIMFHVVAHGGKSVCPRPQVQWMGWSRLLGNEASIGQMVPLLVMAFQLSIQLSIRETVHLLAEMYMDMPLQNILIEKPATIHLQLLKPVPTVNRCAGLGQPTIPSATTILASWSLITYVTVFLLRNLFPLSKGPTAGLYPGMCFKNGTLFILRLCCMCPMWSWAPSEVVIINLEPLQPHLRLPPPLQKKKKGKHDENNNSFSVASKSTLCHYFIKLKCQCLLPTPLPLSDNHQLLHASRHS